MTITSSLLGSNRASAALTTDQEEGITRVLTGMRLDPSDPNGASLSGITSREAIALGVACNGNTAAGDIIVASEADGTRIAILDGTLRLLEPQAA